MKHEFFQACYAHPDTGWAVVNTSANMPQNLSEDFSLVERANAGLAAGKTVPMGKNENPTCMFEIYCRNNAVGLVRTQYGISDGQGRPISFSHGFIFVNAYEFLKNPNNLLQIKRDNFADMRISDSEKAEIRTMPGALNRELIRRSSVEEMNEELSLNEPLSLNNALDFCGISEEKYRAYILAVYSHLLSSNTEKNLYVKTDGTEEFAWNLLYLTYIAVPYSMRVLLSASTYLHTEQHSTKLIFCYELPEGVPQIDPVSGENNVMTAVVEKRTKDRNPFISIAMDHVMKGNQDAFYNSIESCLKKFMGNERLNTMPVTNLACSICRKEYENPDRLQGIIYGWLALNVQNSENWERIACFLLNKADENGIDLGEEIKQALSSRLDTAITGKFKAKAQKYLT